MARRWPILGWRHAWVLGLVASAQGASLDEVIRRLDTDTASGKPLVAHVVVALCDNEFQGIVPVTAALGNGDDPKSNLYWGAMYGVRTWFRSQRDWQSVRIEAPRDPRVLDRVVFTRTVIRGGKPSQVYLVAEAWRGRNIADAIRRFLELNRGEHPESFRDGGQQIEAGGAAHVVAFVGHNGLMDFAAPSLPPSKVTPQPRASVVLACMSESYFAPLLARHSVPLITTTGLMAPEAYSLGALLEAWFAGGDGSRSREAAARAYAKYQRTSESAARRLFRTHASATLD